MSEMLTAGPWSLGSTAWAGRASLGTALAQAKGSERIREKRERSESDEGESFETDNEDGYSGDEDGDSGDEGEDASDSESSSDDDGGPTGLADAVERSDEGNVDAGEEDEEDAIETEGKEQWAEQMARLGDDERTGFNKDSQVVRLALTKVSAFDAIAPVPHADMSPH